MEQEGQPTATPMVKLHVCSYYKTIDKADHQLEQIPTCVAPKVNILCVATMSVSLCAELSLHVVCSELLFCNLDNM